MEMCDRDPEAFSSSPAYRLLAQHKLAGLGTAKRALRTRGYWEGVRREVLPEAAAWAAAGSERRAARRNPLATNARYRQIWLESAQRPCANLGCTNVSGASEGRLVACTRRCGGCGLVRYCSAACRDAAWPEHSLVCGQQLPWLGAQVEEGGGQLPPEVAASLAALASRRGS